MGVNKGRLCFSNNIKACMVYDGQMFRKTLIKAVMLAKVASLQERLYLSVKLSVETIYTILLMSIDLHEKLMHFHKLLGLRVLFIAQDS